MLPRLAAVVSPLTLFAGAGAIFSLGCTAAFAQATDEDIVKLEKFVASDESPDVYSVLVDSTPIADVVQPADGVPRLSVVPATIDLAGAEIELVSLVARESRLQRAIDAYCASGVDVENDPPRGGSLGCDLGHRGDMPGRGASHQ